MKYFHLVLLCFVYVFNSYGQTRVDGVDVEITKERKAKKISTKALITPAFPGGDSSFIQSIEKELNRSIPVNGVKTGKYFVSVKFIIEKDNSIADIRCVNDPGFGLYAPVRFAILRNFARWPKSSTVKVSQYHITSTAQKGW